MKTIKLLLMVFAALMIFGCSDDPNGGESQQGPAPEDCAEDEVWTEDVCLRCGPADECLERGSACEKICETDEECGGNPLGCENGRCPGGAICG